MCRAGGRRCKGSHASSRATQNTRQQRSRARRALKKAKTSGNADAIRKATERLDRANAAHQTAKEKAMSHNDNSNAADHSTDVTDPTMRHINITQIAGNVSSQNDINTEDVQFNVRRPAQDRDVTPEPPTDHTEPRSQHHGGRRGRSITNIADGGSHVGVQAGVVYGDVHVNDRRVSTGSGQHEHHDADVTNIATGGSRVDVQVGAVHGDARTGRPTNSAQTDTSTNDATRQMVQRLEQLAAMDRERRGQKDAAQEGDVTATRSASRPSGSGTVTNIVHGNVNGIQTDTVGTVHIGPNGITIDGKRVR